MNTFIRKIIPQRITKVNFTKEKGFIYTTYIMWMDKKYKQRKGKAHEI